MSEIQQTRRAGRVAHGATRAPNWDLWQRHGVAGRHVAAAGMARQRV